MSTFSAFVAAEPSDEDLAWLASAIEVSRSAGPDGHSSRRLGRCGLGHTLLQAGHEVLGPNTLDGRTWIAADARLDDRGALVALLRPSCPEITDDSSDADLLLGAYRRWGERLVEHIAGEFAFALWDTDRQLLLCARDQIGVAPLHYAQAGRTLLVATALEAPLRHPAVDGALDDSAVADFLVFGHHMDLSATMFAAVRQLPPAHVLTWQDGQIRIRRYWTLPEWQPYTRFRSAEDAGARLRDLLDAAVADRLSGTRASVLLSGGMDSTSVAASARHVLQARGMPGDALRGFTGVLGGDSGDQEGEFARLVADELGIPLEIEDATTRPTIDPFAEPLMRPPEPIPYQFTDYLVRYVSEPARHAPVVLTGQGGDVLFQSFPWYWLELLSRGRVLRLGEAFAERLRLHAGLPRPFLRAILRAAVQGRQLVLRLPPWLNDDFARLTGVAERQQEQSPRPFGTRTRDIDVRALVSDPMWAGLLRIGDPTFTGAPVRARHPLTDLRLIAFAQSLPPDPWLVNKRILREAGHARLPEAVYKRPKTLLVQTPPPGVSSSALTALAEIVVGAPGLARFINTERLSQEVIGSVEDDDVWRRWFRERAVGLAYWLWHRQKVS